MATEQDEARYRAMIEFLGTFPTLSENPPDTLEGMSDGVAIFEALSEIAPDYFDPTTIARHLGDNWALKASNIRKLLRNLETFFHDVLQKDADFDVQSDHVNSISRSGDKAAVASLLELVAAAAVTCEHRGEFVSRIMTMSGENQVEMKGILERSLARLSDYEHEEDEDGSDSDDNEMVFDHAAETPTSLAHDGFSAGDREELEKALMDARRELASFKSQAALQSEDSENAQKKLRALVEDLQDRLVKRQDELITAEEELQNATSELDDHKAKVLELEDSKDQMADELDVANAKVEQLRKAEATVLSYRKKLEGVGVMNQQMTELEDQAASYLRQIMDLENDVKRLPKLQKSVEGLQSKVAQLEKENEELGSVAKIATTETTEFKSKLAAADNAKKLYEEELRELKAQHDDGAHLDDEVGSAMKGLSLTSADSISEAREKTLRLEVENKKLRDDLDELKSQGTEQVSSSVSDGDVDNLQSELSRLKGELADKEAEKAKIGSDKDKLEAYTKRTLAKFQEKYLVALQECKSKLKEKQDKIEALESRSSSEKTAQKREERLLSSTIYELGLAIMQNRLKER